MPNGQAQSPEMIATPVRIRSTPPKISLIDRIDSWLTFPSPPRRRSFLRNRLALGWREALGPRLAAFQPSQASERDGGGVLLQFLWQHLGNLPCRLLDHAEGDLIGV
jgi:hypothetical protein